MPWTSDDDLLFTQSCTLTVTKNFALTAGQFDTLAADKLSDVIGTTPMATVRARATEVASKQRTIIEVLKILRDELISGELGS